MQSLFADELHHALTWYESDEGRRILMAETELRQGFGKNIINYFDPKREKLIKQLLK